MQGTPVVVAKPDQAEAGEDMGALIATNFGSDEEGPPDFIGLEALPPPEASPVKEAAVVPEQAPETLQPYEMVQRPHPTLLLCKFPAACSCLPACCFYSSHTVSFSCPAQQQHCKYFVDSVQKTRGAHIVQAEHWAVDKMAARLAAMLETASGRNLIERIEVLMPRPFDLCTTATIPQVGLQMLSVGSSSSESSGCHC